MPKIVLAAFNARYAHTSFGARYLLANLGELQDQSELQEFDLQVQPRTAVEKILATNPRIVGIGCYIWNIGLATKVAALLKSIRPEIKLILGGPEISHETEIQEIFQYADHVICGEGEIEFPKLCRQVFYHKGTKDTKNPKTFNEKLSATSCPSSLRGKVIQAEPVDVAQIKLPYDCYTDEDIAHRAIYVEASRGCPFRCEYCMSSLNPTVRYFPDEKLFSAFGKLLDRGVRTFKFVDRTFNLDISFAIKVLEFFRARHKPGMMLHFEMIPNRLPDELMEAVKQCPPSMLQFEIGIQTFNEEVAHRIQRPLDIEKIEANMRCLREETGVHIHSDLIAGLPGEDLESFEAGFNRLLALNPQEIQLGILKRLRGTQIDRHSTDWKMVYSPHAPYEILQTSLIPFEQMQRIQHFARYWNLIVNNGHFIHTAPLIWQDAAETAAVQKTVPQASRLHSEAAGTAAVQETVPQASRLPAPDEAAETTGFNPHQKIHQTHRKNYPHWTQEGCTYFVTFRLADSIPQSRINEYEELHRKWEEHHRPPYSEQERKRFDELFSQRVNDWLDAGAGSCCLRNPEISRIVADTLLHFDGERYELDEWVVMPNHVHLLVRPLDGYELPDILHSWKSFSAHAVNEALLRTGQLWQRESYDHIVRDVEELNRIRNYIRRNPEMVGIRTAHAGSRRDACGTEAAGTAAVQETVSQVIERNTSNLRLPKEEEASAFAAFMAWSDWLYAKTNTTGNLHMLRLAKLLMEFLTEKKGMDENPVAKALWKDYRRGNRHDVPGFLKKFGSEKGLAEGRRAACDTETVPQATRLPRQSRHLKD